MSLLTEAPPKPVAAPARRRRAPVTALLALAAIVAVVGAVIAVGSPGSSATAAATTRTVTVKRGVVQSTVSGSGSLAAQRDRELAFSSSGTVKHVYAAAGDKVAEGEVLATLETADATTKRLKAPFAGTIATVGISAGDSSGSSSTGAGSSSDSTTAFELVSLKRYDMTVSLSESDIGKVKTGQAATVTVDATGDELAARVQKVALLPTSSSAASDSAGASSSSSSSAVAYAVTLRLTQSSADLKPGMSASADIVTSETTGLVVPTTALRGNSVTVSKHGKKTATQVQTGVAGDSTTQIVSGLSAGDTVVVTSRSATAGTSSSSTAKTQDRQQGGFPSGGPPAGFTPPSGGFGG